MDGVDPFAAVPNGARHAALAELAQTGPLHHFVLPTSVPAWVITGYAQARAALADPGLHPLPMTVSRRCCSTKLTALPVRLGQH